MADSLTGLGTVSSIFRYKPDWVDLPSGGMQYGREMLQAGASINVVRSLSDYFPQNVISYGYKNLSKSDEYNIIKFFYDRSGRLERFWLPIWFKAWKPYVLVTPGYKHIVFRSGYKSFHIYQNSFADVYNGYERLFVLLNNGDLITRHITSCQAETAPGFTHLYVCNADTNFDRDIYDYDISFFGSLILCRFDQDRISFAFDNISISSVRIRFIELVQEYVFATKKYMDTDGATTKWQDTDGAATKYQDYGG